METNPQKHPLLFCLVSFLLAIPLSWLFMTPIVRLVPFYFGEAVKYALTLLVVFALCQETWGGYPFSLRRQGLLKGLFPAGLPGLILAAGVLMFSFQKPEQIPDFTVLIGFPLCTAMGAAAEEFLFRGLLLAILLKAWGREKKGLLKAITVSSLFFALRYLINLISNPGTPISTLGQVGTTFLAGIYLAAVYLRTGNIWVCVLLHFLEAFCAGLWPLFSAAPVTDSTVGAALLVGIHLICLPAAFFLLLGAPSENFSTAP